MNNTLTFIEIVQPVHVILTTDILFILLATADEHHLDIY